MIVKALFILAVLALFGWFCVQIAKSVDPIAEADYQQHMKHLKHKNKMWTETF
jgi:predicted negative regulator of RcsB-dependent stress response